jgi:7-cyano-7-deazaguanine synthase
MQLKFDFNMAKHVVVSLSGGMDSSTLLLRALNEYKTVTALSFDYGQKHRVELDRAQSLIDYLSILMVITLCKL